MAGAALSTAPLLTAGYSSDSAAETDDEAKADLPQDYVGRNAQANQRVSIKLHEVGPRMNLTLVKVEEGVCNGATLYHALVTKTEEEANASAERIEARVQLKEQRRQAQLANVEAKKLSAQQKADEKVARRKRRLEVDAAADGDDDDAFARGDEDMSRVGVKEMTDAEWYTQEVGEEPDPDMFKFNRPKYPEGGGQPQYAGDVSAAAGKVQSRKRKKR